MQLEAVGFWGAFFGCAALSLVAALLAFTRSARRVALTGSLAALLSAVYALVFLGWVPVADRESLHRLQAATAIATAAVLAMLLFALLGILRKRDAFARTAAIVAAVSAVAFALAWLVPASTALAIGIAIVNLMIVAGLAASLASVRRGERTGWLALGALAGVFVGTAVLDWYTFHPDRTPWTLHALAAVVGIVYLMCIAVAMWSRYAYLIEVSRVMTHGRNFDPVTSMPSYEAGQPMAEPFTGVEGRACGIIVVSISNLTMLEELHGRAAYNHALFVCASRLRRMALPGAELVRLREDAFVLVMRVPRDAAQVVDCARNVMQRLSRPVTLGMSREITALEESRATWEPSLGIGVLLDEPGADPSLTVAGARAVSRTAWSYPSRMAWFDEAAGTVNELPAAG